MFFFVHKGISLTFESFHELKIKDEHFKFPVSFLTLYFFYIYIIFIFLIVNTFNIVKSKFCFLK